MDAVAVVDNDVHGAANSNFRRNFITDLDAMTPYQRRLLKYLQTNDVGIPMPAWANEDGWLYMGWRAPHQFHLDLFKAGEFELAAWGRKKKNSFPRYRFSVKDDQHFEYMINAIRRYFGGHQDSFPVPKEYTKYYHRSHPNFHKKQAVLDNHDRRLFVVNSILILLSVFLVLNLIAYFTRDKIYAIFYSS
jgi:hypothetical protein